MSRGYRIIPREGRGLEIARILNGDHRLVAYILYDGDCTPPLYKVQWINADGDVTTTLYFTSLQDIETYLKKKQSTGDVKNVVTAIVVLLITLIVGIWLFDIINNH